MENGKVPKICFQTIGALMIIPSEHYRKLCAVFVVGIQIPSADTIENTWVITDPEPEYPF
jgi:hypothetical protein